MIPLLLAYDPIKAPGNIDGNVIAEIVRWLMIGVGIIAVVIIVYSAFLMVTASGEPEKFKKGRQALIAGVIGLFIALMAGAIVQIIMNGLK